MLNFRPSFYIPSHARSGLSSPLTLLRLPNLPLTSLSLTLMRNAASKFVVARLLPRDQALPAVFFARGAARFGAQTRGPTEFQACGGRAWARQCDLDGPIRRACRRRAWTLRPCRGGCWARPRPDLRSSNLGDRGGIHGLWRGSVRAAVTLGRFWSSSVSLHCSCRFHLM